MIGIAIICFCLLLNATFASIEMAFVTIRRNELRLKAKRGNRNAARLLQLRENPERALSVIQIGITLVGAISAAVGGAGAEETLSPLFRQHLGLSAHISEILSIAVVVIPLTYLSVVLGELVPKTIALRYPQAVLRFGTTVLVTGSKVLGPLVSIFEFSTRMILKLVLRNAKPNAEGMGNEAEVDLAGMEPRQRQYILNLSHIETKRISDIALPWEHAVCVQAEASFGKVLEEVIRSGHTRLPVLGAGGAVMGILHSKEFLAFVDSGNTDWQSIIRSALKVTPEDHLLSTLQRLQSKKQHMAVVYDKSDKPVSIVTIEDILEEIFGDLYDEDDDGLVQKLLHRRHNRGYSAQSLAS